MTSADILTGRIIQYNYDFSRRILNAVPFGWAINLREENRRLFGARTMQGEAQTRGAHQRAKRGRFRNFRARLVGVRTAEVDDVAGS